MIVESLGDHEDAEVAKGAKQAAENCIKKRLKEINYATVEGTLQYHCRKKKPSIKKLSYMQNCSRKRRRPPKSIKGILMMSENHQLPKNHYKCCQKKLLRRRLVDLTRYSKRTESSK